MSFAATIIKMVTPSSAIQSAVKTAAKESDSFFESVVKSITGGTVNSVSTPARDTESAFQLPTSTKQFRKINDILGPDKFNKFNNPNLKKHVNPSFENYAKRFINTEPELLFVCEYFVDDASVGLLLVWERMLDATHYEVFKKNLFSERNKFERVLFLDAISLEEETSYYLDYVQNTLGISLNKEEIFIILDTSIKEDRIYEYKIRSARVPKNATEVDYDFVLSGKKLVNEVAVDDVSRNTLFDVAGITLGSKDLAWTISLVNETVPFFGRGPYEKSLGSFDLPTNQDKDKFILMAINNEDVMKIFNESIALFELKETLLNLIASLGGLPVDFREAFMDSVDEIAGTFSYDFFKKEIKTKSPVFSLVLDVAESAENKNFAVTNRLSKLSINLPSETGSESFSSIQKLTKILNFVNKTFLAVLYAQDDTQRLSALLEEIKEFVAPADPVDKAISDLPIDNIQIKAEVAVGSIIDVHGSEIAVAAEPVIVDVATQAIEALPRQGSGGISLASGVSTAVATDDSVTRAAVATTPSVIAAASTTTTATPTAESTAVVAVATTSELRLSNADLIAGPAPSATVPSVSISNVSTSIRSTTDVRTTSSTRRSVRIL